MRATLIGLLLVASSSEAASGDQVAPTVKDHAVVRAARIATSDYPVVARRAGEAGKTQVRFLVDPIGVPQDCEVIASSGSASLDRRTCELVLGRFRFKPARDVSSKNVPEYWEQRISWERPESSDPLIRLEYLAPAAALVPASRESAGKAKMTAGHISDDDYPAEARQARESGTVTVDFDLGATGSVTDCRVAKSSGSAALDKRTCELIVERFRYELATDANGRAKTETKTQHVTWRLPDPPVGMLRAELRYDIDEKGNVARCTVMVATGDHAADGDLCRAVAASRSFPVRLGPDGRAVSYSDIVDVYVKQ